MIEAMDRAIMCNNLKAARGLCESGLDVNGLDGFGVPFLSRAAEYGSLEIVRELCQRGADVNATWSNDRTALMMASLHGNLKIVKELCEAGADVNALDIAGRTPLAYAGGRKKIVEYLLSRGATVVLTAEMPPTRFPLHLQKREVEAEESDSEVEESDVESECTRPRRDSLDLYRLKRSKEAELDVSRPYPFTTVGDKWCCGMPKCTKQIDATKKSLIAYHKNTHSPKYICEHCNEAFPQKCSLQVHIRTNHTHEKPYKCSSCEKAFTQKACLDIHVKRYH
jgi:ankyrin repeat protein